MTPARIVLVVVAVAAAAGLAVTLASSEQRLAGTNRIPANHAIADVPAGMELCQDGEVVPRGTAAVRFAVETTEGFAGPLRLTVHSDARTPATGTSGSGKTGVITVPLDEIGVSSAGRVCIVNQGGSTIRPLGDYIAPEAAARLDGTPVAGRFTIDYLRAGEESLASMLPTVVHRAGVGKPAFVGGWWSLLVMALAVLLAIGIAFRLLLAEEQR